MHKTSSNGNDLLKKTSNNSKNLLINIIKYVAIALAILIIFIRVRNLRKRRKNKLRRFIEQFK